MFADFSKLSDGSCYSRMKKIFEGIVEVDKIDPVSRRIETSVSMKDIFIREGMADEEWFARKKELAGTWPLDDDFYGQILRYYGVTGVFIREFEVWLNDRLPDPLWVWNECGLPEDDEPLVFELFGEIEK